MNIDQIRAKYPHLDQLFGAYFYAEWVEEYNTEKDVIVAFTQDNEVDELLDALLEIEEIKKQFPEEEKLKKIIENGLGLGNGLGIYRIGMTAFQWLDFVASIIKRELNNRKSKT